jgi:hypothetical protein
LTRRVNSRECICFFIFTPVNPLDRVTSEVAAKMVDRPVVGNHVRVNGVTSAGDLVGDYVGIAKALKAIDGHLLGNAHAMEERLVLHYVVGVGCEGDMERVLEFASFWEDEDNSGARALY